MPKEYVINFFSRNDSKIEECLRVLSIESEPDVYINAYCYLIYRALEGKFEDLELLFDKFNEAKAKLEQIEDTTSKARWSSSFTIAYCYLYINTKGTDQSIIDFAQSGMSEDIVIKWPRIMVNMMMLGLICCSYYANNKDFDKVNENINKTFELYKVAISNSTIESVHCSHYIVYELKEAALILSACILLGKLSNFALNYDELTNLPKEIRNSIRSANSNSIYYKTFCKVIPDLTYSNN
jgi:hypothetical protein